MCLVTTEEVKVAEKDIIVYKSVSYIDEDSCTSLFQYFRYTFGKTLTCQLGIKTVNESRFIDGDTFMRIHEVRFADTIAMDYFDKLCANKRATDRTAKDSYKICANKPITVRIVSEGFHSACSEHRLNRSRYNCIIECVIPKGSNYIIDGSGLLVSDSIRAVKYVTRDSNTESSMNLSKRYKVRIYPYITKHGINGDNVTV